MPLMVKKMTHSEQKGVPPAHLLNGCQKGPRAEPVVQVAPQVLPQEVGRGGGLPPRLGGPKVGLLDAPQPLPAGSVCD